ncbi:MAG: hypothetical protein [Caudoviricetes sp.]|nr:MAG: hypothetical protein [Caudoviricetes sp.]
MVELQGFHYIMLVVVNQNIHLSIGQTLTYRERQVFDVLASHVELKNLQTGGFRLVVEVPNLEQVNLLNQNVSRFHRTTETVGLGFSEQLLNLAIDFTRADDKLFTVFLGFTALVKDVVDHRIVKPDVVESNHSVFVDCYISQECKHFLDVITTIRDFIHTHTFTVSKNGSQCKDVRISLDIKDPIVKHFLEFHTFLSSKQKGPKPL